MNTGTPKHQRYLKAKNALAFMFSKATNARRWLEECEVARNTAKYDSEQTALLHELAAAEEHASRLEWEAESAGQRASGQAGDQSGPVLDTYAGTWTQR